MKIARSSEMIQFAATHRFVAKFEEQRQLDATAIAPAFAWWVDGDGAVYLASPLVAGSDLYTVLDAGALDDPRALAVLRRVADALDAIHRAGLVRSRVNGSAPASTDRG